MKQKKQKTAIHRVSLDEVYPHLGSYSAKLLIDPKISAAYETISVTAKNSDGVNFPIDYKRWGTKVNVKFVIDESTPDGVTVIDIILSSDGKVMHERFDFWVIKP